MVLRASRSESLYKEHGKLPVYSVVGASRSRKFMLAARKDLLCSSMARRVESAEEKEEGSVIDSEGKEKPMKKGKQGL